MRGVPLNGVSSQNLAPHLVEGAHVLLKSERRASSEDWYLPNGDIDPRHLVVQVQKVNRSSRTFCAFGHTAWNRKGTHGWRLVDAPYTSVEQVLWRPPLCPNGHGLTRAKSLMPADLSCDGCKGNFGPFCEPSLSCSKCDYDLCAPCANEHKGAPGSCWAATPFACQLERCFDAEGTPPAKPSAAKKEKRPRDDEEASRAKQRRLERQAAKSDAAAVHAALAELNGLRQGRRAT